MVSQEQIQLLDHNQIKVSLQTKVSKIIRDQNKYTSLKSLN